MIILGKIFSVITAAAILISAGKCQQKENKNFRNQISLSGDNDALAFQGTDGYYTSGLFLNFSRLKKMRGSQTLKTIYNLEAGQKIFTPGIREVYVITEIDRPITSYLYGKFSINKFKLNNSFLSYGISIGTMGSSAQGEKVLNWFHPFIKINSSFWDWMWRYQLKNEVGINFHGSFAKSLISSNSLPFLQITPKSEVTLGTTFTNLSQSVALQVGKFNSMSESIYWGSRLSHPGSAEIKKEFFFFYQPQITYQIYNATVQGGMFRSDKGAITSDIRPFILSHEIGLMTSVSRYSASFHLTFQSREATLQEKNHAYGKLQLGIRF